MVAAIVAVDKNWGIGKNRELLVNIPEDRKFFKDKTKDSIVIMGRKTWDSLPIKPLLNRTNYIVSRKATKDINSDIGYISLDKAIELIRNTHEQNIFIIGGGQIYKELLPYCDTLYVTKIFENYEPNVFFPNIEEMDEWEVVEKSYVRFYYAVSYQFYTYKRKEND